MTTPAKSELDAARERLELRERSARLCSWAVCYVNNDDLRLVLDALKEAERENRRLATRLDEEVFWGHRRCDAEVCLSSGTDCPAGSKETPQ